MTKLERLKKKAADAYAAAVVAGDAYDTAVDLWRAADDAIANALDELDEYLKEHGDGQI